MSYLYLYKKLYIIPHTSELYDWRADALQERHAKIIFGRISFAILSRSEPTKWGAKGRGKAPFIWRNCDTETAKRERAGKFPCS